MLRIEPYAILALLAGCAPQPPEGDSVNTTKITIFEGAPLIPGDALLLTAGRERAAGPLP